MSNGSLAMNIADEDYTPILEAIGRSIVEKSGKFTLRRAPTRFEEMKVTLVHADGTSTILPSSVYSVSERTLTITDLNTILSFRSSDTIVINYEPATLF